MRKLILVLLAVWAACDGESHVEPVVTTVIEIVPDPVPMVPLGLTVQLFVVGEVDSTRIKWTSSNPAVATVDNTGLVTPIDTGTIFVHADALDADAHDSTRIIVIEPFPGPPAGLSIIEAVDSVTGAPIDTAAVRGVVRLRVGLDAPPNQADGVLRVTLRDQEVCREEIAGRRLFEFSCFVNTRSFPNGPATVRAFAIDPDGTVFAATSRPSWNLAN